jgi:hypothetical protein
MRKVSSPDYKFLGNCPICNKRFTKANAVSLSEQGGMQTFYVECATCASSVVLGVAKNIPGVVTTVGMLTDMKYSDINRMEDARPLTWDDVLEMHMFLEQKTKSK